ncbi:MAG: 3-keto-disaccharide hydrolase [Bacteroidota bacterium]
MTKKLQMLAAVVVFTVAMFSSCQNTGKQEAGTDVPEVEDTVEDASAPNTLTEEEREEGWRLHFDGEDAEGWRGYMKDSLPGAWEIVDGTIHCQGSGRGEAGAIDGGDIIYDQKFDNFHLKLEWKISEGGNSGIFYLGQEGPDFIWKTAPEMQVLDNERHPDAMLGKDGNRKAGSLYDLIPADPQNTKPAGEWNSVEIIVYKGTVVHRQNGETVLEYHLWTPEWEEMVADSKFPELNPDWANVAQEGYIGLQDHGDDVWFRDIKIKEL